MASPATSPAEYPARFGKSVRQCLARGEEQPSLKRQHAGDDADDGDPLDCTDPALVLLRFLAFTAQASQPRGGTTTPLVRAIYELVVRIADPGHEQDKCRLQRGE